MWQIVPYGHIVLKLCTCFLANLKAILEEVKAFGKAHSLKGKLLNLEHLHKKSWGQRNSLLLCYIEKFLGVIRNVVLSSTRGPGIHISGSQQL
jgi:hypothetical protein